MKDPYVYEGSNVLKNNLNIRDLNRLAQAEADITVIKLLTIESIKEKKLNFDYLKKIHKHIFEDIYPFAGELRTIPISKGEAVLGGDSVRYSNPKEIEKDWNSVRDLMDQIKWNEITLDQKAEVFSIAVAGLWQAHPFREGNTRTTITFASHYAEANGFPLDVELLSVNSQFVRNALVKASDGQYAEYKYLRNIMKDCITLGEENHIIKEIKKMNIKPNKRLIDNMKNLNQAFQKLQTVGDLKEHLKYRNALVPEKRELLDKVLNDFDQEEKKQNAAAQIKGKGLTPEI